MNDRNDGTSAGSYEELPLPPLVVDFETLDQGAQSGIAANCTTVLANETQWMQLWREHGSLRLPPPAAPIVDFSRWRVIGVALGERPTAGYGVRIDSVVRQGDKLIVNVEEIRPPRRHGASPSAVLPLSLCAHPLRRRREHRCRIPYSLARLALNNQRAPTGPFEFGGGSLHSAPRGSGAISVK